MQSFQTPAQLRALLKSHGIKQNQVSVKQNSSLTYLTLTVRDPAISIPALEALIQPLHTWQMDQTDYVTGQSIHVETSEAVDDAHAAPYLPLITAAPVPDHDGAGVELMAGIILWRHGWNVYLSTRTNQRKPYAWLKDFENRTPHTMRALALNLAHLLAAQEWQTSQQPQAPQLLAA